MSWWEPADERIVRRLAANTSIAEIADHLEISQSTVQRRLKNLKERFGVTATIEVVVEAVRRGWI